MSRESKHNPFCFAGEPAPCKGYFPGDVLPCVCETEGVVAALSQQALPAPAGMPASTSEIKLEPELALGAAASIAG